MKKKIMQILIQSAILLEGRYGLALQKEVAKVNIPLTGILVLDQASFGGVKIATGTTNISFTLDSTNHLSPGVTATVGIELSLDDGITYEEIARASRPGGVIFGDHGVQVTSFQMNTKLKEPDNPNRRVRIFLRVEGGSLSTAGGSITIE